MNNFQQVLDGYENELKWLRTLISDPLGERYLIKRSVEEKKARFQQCIDRTEKFLEFLGNPQDNYKSVHVTGTSGKGSVTVMIGRILKECGFKVGVHTSPYIQIPNEKWLINDALISPSKLAKAIGALRDKLSDFEKIYSDYKITYGEFQVAMTHAIFSSERVDWGIIESGMGGRFDPTNVLNPELAVITSVGYDHIESLGATLSEIAFHKAGIIKRGKPVVVGAIHSEPLKVIEEEADRKCAHLYSSGEYCSHVLKKVDETSVIDVTTFHNEYHGISVALRGMFQAGNAALAIAACDILAFSNHFDIPSDNVSRALQNISFPGRFEYVQRKPLVILDGAHNPDKMKALSDSIQRLYSGKQYTLIVGMLAMKDVRQSLASIIAGASAIIITRVEVFGKPSTSTENMAEIVRNLTVEMKLANVEIDTCCDMKGAIALAMEKTPPDSLIVITGSIYMLRDAREHWYPQHEILYSAEYTDPKME